MATKPKSKSKPKTSSSSSGAPQYDPSKYGATGSSSAKNQRKAIGVPGAYDTTTGQYTGYTAAGPQAYQYEPGNVEQRVPQPGQYDIPGPGAPGSSPMPSTVIPRYFSGDEYQIGSLPPDQILKIQMALKQGGWMSGDFVAGVPDASTIKAYKNALSAANTQGVSVYDVLTTSVQNAKTQTAVRAPLQIRLTNPEDLKNVVQQAAKTLYGGNLPDNAANAFVAQFQAQEAAAQQADYATQGLTAGGTAAGGGTFTAPPDPGVAAQNYIKTTFPADYAAAGVGERFDQWTNLLNSTMSGGEGQAQH